MALAPTKEFKRPIGEQVSDAELESWAKAQMDQAYRSRVIPELKWLTAMAFLEGFTQAEGNWITRRLTNPQNPSNSIRCDVPELINRMRREKGRLLSVFRVPVTEPIVFGNPDIWRLNRDATGAAAYIWNASNFPAKALNFVTDLLNVGTAGILPYWDKDLGFGMDEPGDGGDVNFRVIPGYELYPYPANARDDDSTQALIWARTVTEEWVYHNYPEAIDKEKAAHVGTPADLLNSMVNGAPYVNYTGYLVRTVFIKPSRRFPRGEMFIMVGDHIYKRMGLLPFWIGGRPVIPIKPARWFTKGTGWYGESFSYTVTRLNREINRQMGYLVKRAAVKAHPGYLMVPTSSCNVEDFKKQAGGVVQYRPSLLDPGQNRPYWLVPPPSTTDSDVIVNRFTGYLDDVTSQHNVSQGQSAGRVEARSAMQLLQQADLAPSEETIRSVQDTIAHAFAVAIEMGRAKWKSIKHASVAGPAGVVSYSVNIDPRRIPSMREIKVVTGMDVPMDSATELQFLTQLASSPYKGAQPQIEVEEYRRGLQAMGVRIRGVDLVSPDEETAWRENFLIYNDGITPGQVPEPEPALENSEIHLRVHKRFAATMEVHSASPAVREALAYHIRLTAQNLNGPAVPSEFDSELQQRDAEDLQEEIEGAQAGMHGQPMSGEIPIEALLAQMAGAA